MADSKGRVPANAANGSLAQPVRIDLDVTPGSSSGLAHYHVTTLRTSSETTCSCPRVDELAEAMLTLAASPAALHERGMTAARWPAVGR